MLLSRTQRLLLIDEILNSYTELSFGRFLVTNSNHSLNTAAGGFFRQKVEDIISKAFAERGLDQLVVALNSDRPGSNIFSDLSKYIQLSSLLNKYQTRVLSGLRPMVNRTSLRSKVENFNSDIGKKILVITGPARCGKSYSTDYLLYIATEEKHRTVTIDLEARLGEVNCSDIGDSIVRQLRLNKSEFPSQSDEQDARWVQAYCESLKAALQDPDNAEKLPCWVIIDHFHKAQLSPTVHYLISELCKITRELSGFVLTLIGYDQVNLGLIRSYVDTESIEPISLNDLIDFFECVFEIRSTRGGLPYSESDIALALKSVMDRVDITQSDCLERLFPVLHDECVRLLN